MTADFSIRSLNYCDRIFSTPLTLATTKYLPWRWYIKNQSANLAVKFEGRNRLLNTTLLDRLVLLLVIYLRGWNSSNGPSFMGKPVFKTYCHAHQRLRNYKTYFLILVCLSNSAIINLRLRVVKFNPSELLRLIHIGTSCEKKILPINTLWHFNHCFKVFFLKMHMCICTPNRFSTFPCYSLFTGHLAYR